MGVFFSSSGHRLTIAAALSIANTVLLACETLGSNKSRIRFSKYRIFEQLIAEQQLEYRQAN